MDYRATEANGQATLFFVGELDMAVGDRVGELLQQYGGRNQSVIVDFQGVSFVDSSGIGSLFFYHERTVGHGQTGRNRQCPRRNSRYFGRARFYRSTGHCSWKSGRNPGLTPNSVIVYNSEKLIIRQLHTI